MPNIEHDMDEMFRKASEEYPLMLPDNWEQIAARLALNRNSPAPTNNREFRKLFMILLFLLLFLLTNLFLWVPQYQGQQAININRNDSPSRNVSATASDKDIQRSPTGNEITVNINKPGYEFDAASDSRKPFSQATGLPWIYNTHPVKNNHLPASLVNFQREHSWELIHRDQGDPRMNKPPKPGELQWNYFPEGVYTSVNILTLKLKTENLTLATNPEKPRTRASPYKPSFYFGLLSGIGFNAVKDQGFGRPGFDIGLTAGYRINQIFSIESGILFSKKFCRTDAKYFSMDVIGPAMPPTMHVMDVDGWRWGLEIPLHIRVDLNKHPEHRFFAATGASSFVLMHEKNKYHIMDSGIESKMMAEYEKNRTYVGATFDLSAGYEKKIAGNHNIRIEPYIQIPLKGTGVGSLPVLNTGLRLGFTRSTH